MREHVIPMKWHNDEGFADAFWATLDYADTPSLERGWAMCVDMVRDYFDIPLSARAIRIVVRDTGDDAEGYAEPDVYAVKYFRSRWGSDRLKLRIGNRNVDPCIDSRAAVIVRDLCKLWRVPRVWVSIEVPE